jgi:hypothetical protein
MLLIAYSQRCVLIVRKSIFLVKAVFLIAVFCLSGCDTFFVKRIELQRPSEPLQMRAYEDNKTKIISVIDRIASDNNMTCRKDPLLSRDCDRQPESIVAFEDKQGFTICFFMIGGPFGESKFLHLAETLEKALISSLPDTNLRVSLPDEFPECIIPSSRK